MNPPEVLVSGKASFSMEVPYRLYRSGDAASHPLYVYIHENGRNLTALENITEPLRQLPGYHLLIQAPYPEIKADKSGRAYHWIPRMEDEANETAAREYVSEFLQEVIDGLLPHINGSRLVLVGWEQSRGQVSYFCATRPHYVNELIMFEGSVDQSWMDKDNNRYKHLRVLGLSGKDADITGEVASTILKWIEGGYLKKS